MMMMNGFAMGFFFPKQSPLPPQPQSQTAKPREPQYKISVIEPKRESEAEEPAIFALHAYRFF